MSNVLDFGAEGDGKTDDTNAIEHCLEQGDGVLHFPRRDYVIARPIQIPLNAAKRTSIEGAHGTAKIIMTGVGPAFNFVGTHDSTADPGGFKPQVWSRQRMPTVMNIEIEGRNKNADGLRFEGTMQLLLEGVACRGLRHAVVLAKRNRNVLISHCHFYHNNGVGVFIDRCNLHQINVIGNHISYNRQGGIRIEGSEVRNLQITGNDIEYNNHKSHAGYEPAPTAEIWIDCTAERATVNELTIASNTIQATSSPGGANIRIIEDTKTTGRPPGLIAISGNIIGSQENNVHLTGCYGVTMNGNCIYSGTNRNLLIEQSRQISVTGNHFRRHTPRAGTGVRLVESSDCVISGCVTRDESEEGQASKASLLELSNCNRITVNGNQFIDGVPYGIDVEGGDQINITGNTITDTREKTIMQSAIRWRGEGKENLIANNTLGQGTINAASIEPSAGVIRQ